MPRSRVYVALGRGEVRAGRSLDVLLAAYRVGARVAWRRFAAGGVAAGLEPHDALPAGRVDLRLHRRAVGQVGRGLRAGAVGRRRRAPRAAPAARAAARARPAGRPARRRGGRARGASGACRATLAAFAFAEAESERIVPRLPADAIVDDGRRRRLRAVPDPRRRDRRGQLQHAVGAAPRRGARSVGRVERRGAQPRPRARGARAGGGGSGARPRRARRRRPHDRAAAAQRPPARAGAGALPARAARRRWRPVRAQRMTETLAAWLRRRGGCRRSPSACTSTRRPSATASARCASCSATRSTTRSAASSWSWRCGPRARSMPPRRWAERRCDAQPCPRVAQLISRSSRPGRTCPLRRVRRRPPPQLRRCP